MIKGFRQIALLTAISRVFGLIRTIVYCHFFGAGGLLDAWFIAFKIPNLSRRLFGEGAASASFIPVYTQQLNQDKKQAARLANTVLTLVWLLLTILVLIAWAGIWAYVKFFGANSETSMVLSLTSIMLPYMPMVCLVALMAGILNVHRHFAAPAAAPIILNIFIISVVVFTGVVLKMPPGQQVFAVAIIVLFAGLVQIAMQIPFLVKSGLTLRPTWEIHSEALKRIVLLMIPMILGLIVTQMNTLLDDLIAWWLSASPEKGSFFIFRGSMIEYPLTRGCVTYLNVAQRLYQLPLGVFGISLATAIFPVMSREAAEKNFDALALTISKGIRGAFFVAIPATAGLILVARPLISVILQHGAFKAIDTEITAYTLLFYSLGLSGFFMQHILARAFYSMEDSKTPMLSAVTAVTMNIVLNLTLVWFMGTAGLALSTAICSYLQIVILFCLLRKRLGNLILQGLSLTLFKTITATVFMFLVAMGALKLMTSLPADRLYNILRLAVVVPIAAIVYWTIAKLLRIKELALITGGKAAIQKFE